MRGRGELETETKRERAGDGQTCRKGGRALSLPFCMGGERERESAMEGGREREGGGGVGVGGWVGTRSQT